MQRRTIELIYFLLLLIGDIVSIIVVYYGVYYFRHQDLNVYHLYNDYLIAIIAFYLLFSFAFGLYRDCSIAPISRQTSINFKVVMYVFVVIMSILFIRKESIIFSRIFIVVFFFSCLTVMITFRNILYNIHIFLIEKGYTSQPVIIIGEDEGIKWLVESILDNPQLGYSILGYISEEVPSVNYGIQRKTLDKSECGDEVKSPLNLKYLGIKELGKIKDIIDIVSKHKVKNIFIVRSCFRYDKYENIISLCKDKGIRLKMFSHKINLRRKQMYVYDLAGLPIYTPQIVGRLNLATIKIDIYLKRFIDFVFSLIGIIILFPFYCMIAVLIKIDSKGSVLFKQQRITKNGKKFDIYKFRTMKESAEKEKDKLLAESEATGPIFKIRNDPRITRVGRFLRKYSIDEFPQIINVLKGEMSLVGPRPPTPDEVEKYEPWQKRRLDVIQGMTGLWQISGRSELSFDEMVLLDIYYIENQSVLFDIEIISNTIPVVIFGKGGY